MSHKQTLHFKGLNALRFIAAFSIIIYHTTLSFHSSPNDSPLKMFIHNLTLGVDFFFIISGFLIVYLLLVEREKTNTISLGKFYIRRILRIFPLYYLIIAIAYYQFHTIHPNIDFPKHLYFFGNFSLIETGKWTVGALNPLWSICIEEHFYLVIPLLLLITPISKIQYLFIVTILISIAFRSYISLTVQYNWMHIYAHTLSRCDVLAIGGLLAYFYHKKPSFFKIKSIYLFSAFVILILLMCFVNNSDFTTFTFAVFKKYLFIIPLTILFIGTILSQPKNKILTWLLNQRFINYFGKIFFWAIYVSYYYNRMVGTLSYIQSIFIFKTFNRNNNNYYNLRHFI